MWNRLGAATSISLAAASLASCSGNGQSPQKVTTVNPLSGRLQFAVGTANIFGDLGTGGGALTGLNVVETFRQQSGAQTPGDTAALVNTPTLTGPMVLPATPGSPNTFGATITTGPGPNEVGGNAIRSTPQQAPGSPTVPPSTLGVAGGATGFGLEPFNYTTTGSSSNTFGTPASYFPYFVPAFDALAATKAGDPNAFRPWGGPPAFDPNKDGKGTRDNSGFPTGVRGVSLGLDVFAGVVPSAGAYTLNVLVPTSTQSGGGGTLNATATLGATTVLPAVTPPVATVDGSGGASFAVTLPPGVTEAYVEVIDVGPAMGTSCNGSDAAPVYYTIRATASGTVTLPATDGPGNPGSTTPSICTSAQNTAFNATPAATTPTDGDTFTTQLIGFDYPHYAASYPNSNGNPAPPIAGANGQSDITISSQAAFTQVVGTTGATRAARRGLVPRTPI